MRKAPKVKKSMGSFQKVGQHDPNFEQYLRLNHGRKNVPKILGNPSATKRLYQEYLKSWNSTLQPDEIPF